MTRFLAIVAHFGRFLPRLGPFGFRTAFLCEGHQEQFLQPTENNQQSRAEGRCCATTWRSAFSCLQPCKIRICSWCGAPIVFAVRYVSFARASQPSLGVSSLDLGRSNSNGPFFFCEGQRATRQRPGNQEVLARRQTGAGRYRATPLPAPGNHWSAGTSVRSRRGRD